MNTRARRTDAANVQNKIIGKNLRFIRQCRKMTLEKLAAAAGCRYQQIGKYELGVDQMSAYRIMQLSNLLKVKIKYFFDPTYIERMQAYHKDRTFYAAMPPELLDIDQLQQEAAEAVDAAETQASL